MNKIILFILLTAVFSFSSFAQQPAPITFQPPAVSMLKPGHFYKMKYEHIEIWSYVDAMIDSSNIIYKGMEIIFDGKSIYKDSLRNHIALSKPDYEVKKINNTTYEIFAGENHRPEDIRTTYFKIKNGEVIDKKTLPEFLNTAKDLDNDGKKEYAGVMYDSTTLPEPDGSIWYWPILFYEETKDGLALDSVLTFTENKLIYGTFYGFKNDNKIILPVYKKFEKEVSRIKNIH